VKTFFIEFSYLLASILFILGLRGLSHPETARRGMHLAEFGMVTAVIGTLLQREIISYEWIIAGLLLGSTIGLAMGVWVPMTAMPQRTALSHAFGALAASLVGVSEYYLHGAKLGEFRMGALGFEVLLGSLTTTGSLVAFAKLQGLVPGTPLIYKGQNIFNLSLLAVTIGCFILLFFYPDTAALFYSMLGLAFIFGILLVLPIGAADMPVVISLLNSYAGLASAATGFAISNSGWRFWVHPVDRDVQGNESFDHQRLIRGLRERHRNSRRNEHGEYARSEPRRCRGSTDLRAAGCFRPGIRYGHCAGSTCIAGTGQCA
jgi:NAD(P) transhydrogenase subunit beta